jgi:hypothetical protein
MFEPEMLHDHSGDEEERKEGECVVEVENVWI